MNYGTGDYKPLKRGTWLKGRGLRDGLQLHRRHAADAPSQSPDGRRIHALSRHRPACRRARSQHPRL